MFSSIHGRDLSDSSAGSVLSGVLLSLLIMFLGFSSALGSFLGEFPSLTPPGLSVVLFGELIVLVLIG